MWVRSLVKIWKFVHYENPDIWLDFFTLWLFNLVSLFLLWDLIHLLNIFGLSQYDLISPLDDWSHCQFQFWLFTLWLLFQHLIFVHNVTSDITCEWGASWKLCTLIDHVKICIIHILTCHNVKLTIWWFFSVWNRLARWWKTIFNS